MYQGDSVDGNDGKTFQTNKKVIVSKKSKPRLQEAWQEGQLFRTYMMARGIQNTET